MNKNSNSIPSENRMGTAPIGPLLASMAIPMMLSMLVQAFYNIVDSIFVARISEDPATTVAALNAVSLAFPLQNLMIAFGGGTALGINALISRNLGAQRRDEADRVANTGIFLSLCTAAVFSLIGIFGAGFFFRVQTDVQQTIDYGTDYVTICLGFSVGIFMQFCFERLLQSTGRTSLAMISQLTGALINIILDPLLIFGVGPFPRLEVAGAAIATVAGQIIAATIALIFNLKLNPDIHLKPKYIRPEKETVVSIYKIGLPTIIMQSVGSIMTFCTNKILTGMNPEGDATAVFGAYFKLQSFIFMPIFGMNNGMIPIISYNYGAKRYNRVKKTIRLSIITAICIMLGGMLTFELIPDKLLLLFDATEGMLRIGVPALRIIGTHYILAGFNIIAGSVCQSIGNPLHSLIVSLCRQIGVLLPLAYIFSLSGNLDLVWCSFPIAEIVSLILSITFFRITMKRARSIME